jgi:hypothetical protein
VRGNLLQNNEFALPAMRPFIEEFGDMFSRDFDTVMYRVREKKQEFGI